MLLPCRELLHLHKWVQRPQAGSGYATLVPPAKHKHVLQHLFQIHCREEGRCQTSWQLQNRQLSLSNEDASNLPAALECQAPFLLAQLAHLLQQRPSFKLQGAPSDRPRSTLWFLVVNTLRDIAFTLHRNNEEPELVAQFLDQFLDQLNRAGGAD